MTAQELLPIFEQAVEDLDNHILDKNDYGHLVFYLWSKYDLTIADLLYLRIRKHYDKEESTSIILGNVKYNNKQRLEALKLVVRDLKEEIKQQENGK